MIYLTRHLSARNLKQKRERFAARRQAMIERDERALEQQAAALGVTVHELKHSMAAAYEHAQEAPARRYAAINAADAAAHARVDAVIADAAAFVNQQRAPQTGKDGNVIFLDDAVAAKVQALQDAGNRVEAVRIMDEHIAAGTATFVPNVK